MRRCTDQHLWPLYGGALTLYGAHLQFCTERTCDCTPQQCAVTHLTYSLLVKPRNERSSPTVPGLPEPNTVPAPPQHQQRKLSPRHQVSG